MALADTELGPCYVYAGVSATDGSGGTSLGYTFGPVNLMLKSSSAEKKVTQLGVTIIDRVRNGIASAQIDLAFAEITPTKLAQIWMNVVAPSLTNAAYAVAPRVGVSMLGEALTLCLRPIINGVETTTKDEWIICDKAAMEADFSLVYDESTQRSAKALIHLFPDESNSFRVVRFGDTSA